MRAIKESVIDKKIKGWVYWGSMARPAVSGKRSIWSHGCWNRVWVFTGASDSDGRLPTSSVSDLQSLGCSSPEGPKCNTAWVSNEKGRFRGTNSLYTCFLYFLQLICSQIEIRFCLKVWWIWRRFLLCTILASWGIRWIDSTTTHMTRTICTLSAWRLQWPVPG